MKEIDFALTKDFQKILDESLRSVNKKELISVIEQTKKVLEKKDINLVLTSLSIILVEVIKKRGI